METNSTTERIKKSIIVYGHIVLEILVVVVSLWKIFSNDEMIHKADKAALSGIVVLGVLLLLNIIGNFIQFLMYTKELSKLAEKSEATILQMQSEQNELKEKFSIEKRQIEQDGIKRFEEILNTINLQLKEIPQLKQDAEYKFLLGAIANAFLPVHLATASESQTKDLHTMALSRFCIILKHAFSKVKNCEMFVCIRIPIEVNKKEPLIVQLCSSDDSTIKMEDSTLNGSFSAKYIQNQKGKGFFSNDLCTIENYSNPMFIEYLHDPRFEHIKKNKQANKFFHESVPYEVRKENWPLIFRSTMVASPQEKIKNDIKIYGYLSIASPSIDIWNEEDKKIWLGCAQGITNSIKRAMILARRDNAEKTVQ